MQKKRKENRIYIFLILILLLMVVLSVFSINSMKQDYFNSIGRRAMSFSQITADKLQLENNEIDRLIELDFNQLLEDETNVTFENYVRKFMRSSEVKYVYLLHNLDESEVKYSVVEGEEDYYEIPLGTALDTIYLIDAVIDDETRLEDTDYQGYADKDRYTYLHKEIQAIYDNKEADYIFYKDEWGTYISGFTPVFSAEGDYIGILGADIFVDEYIKLLQNRIVVLLMFWLLILILIYSMLRVYKQIFKIESVMNNLKSRVYYDEMTGLYNRSMLKEEEKKYTCLSAEKNVTLAAVMIDIDSFKHINDEYGHLKGDEVIVAISDKIQSALQGNGQPFRYGGDEFLILLVNKEYSKIHSITEMIRKKVSEISIHGINEKISVSTGISVKESNAEIGFQSLVLKADEMMYKSKREGGNVINVYTND